jgi:hypothetical protein
MFDIDLPYKSATPMKFDSSTEAWFKNFFKYFHFSTSLEMKIPPLRLRSGWQKNYCILRPVLWMQ